MEKKLKTMPIRMASTQNAFIRGVAEEVGLPPSTTARLMLRGWERLGRRVAAEVVLHLKSEDKGPSRKSS